MTEEKKMNLLSELSTTEIKVPQLDKMKFSNGCDITVCCKV